ncbi:hypothetical protein HUG10_18955 (plasmid) [Halorarum halophilum]|uniref:HVO-B0008-like N-terminal domain-containing protein n=1 Tax=Halorarum halophilum TaxID=2743090 RepID=A0A7D5GP05_9EURY|nr:hypothetical protein [Halobaculum halophilum]QLG29687.1 hypothetical protein HUG10_18955 [Halobaculum halophilum]
MTYIVSCSECNIRDEIEDPEEVLELQERHQAEYGDRHILEFHLVH